jgi:uncharacterized repeat protein (TIGR03803 family)
MKFALLTIGFAVTTLVTVPAQAFKVIYTFTNSPDGGYPRAGLVLSSGTLYGTTSSGGSSSEGTVFEVSTNGTGYTVLFRFTGNGHPYAGLVLGGDKLFGTTFGDTTAPIMPGFGSVFKIDTSGNNFTQLKDFDDNGGAGGLNPVGGLVLNGTTLYGTTSGAGGLGTIFKISTNGTGFTVLKTFSSSTDGLGPEAGLVLDGSTLYGTTFSGGSSSNGVVFKINTDGTGFAVLKHFSALNSGVNNDGANPVAGLVLSGNTLYGTTSGGGSSGNGVVFKIRTNGTCFAVFESFPAINNLTNSDGARPCAGLLLDGGTLYGTTYSGGSSGKGVVFSLPVPPEIINDSSFGVRTNRFGFNVAGFSNQVVVMEACTNLVKTNWVPLQTNTLGAGPAYFSDSKWTNYPSRFYRVRLQ